MTVTGYVPGFVFSLIRAAPTQVRDLDEEIESIADAVGPPGELSITQRLETIERVLFALARAQDIDPDAAP